MRTIKSVTPEGFVLAWQAASSVKACAKALDIPQKACCQRATNYRKLGIKLKRYRVQRADVDALNRLIDKGKG